MKANYKPKEKIEQEIPMTLYDLNKNYMAGQEPLGAEELDAALNVLVDYVSSEFNSKYFMLLSKELSYYTLFVRDRSSEASFKEEVTACLNSLGDILSIELNNSNNVPEIWIKTPENEAYILYLFSYDDGVIGFGG